MSHDIPQPSEEKPRPADALSSILEGDDLPLESDDEELSEQEYLNDLQLIRGLTGHPEYSTSLEQSASSQERLKTFQGVIDELLPVVSAAGQSAPSATVPTLPPTRSTSSRTRFFFNVAAALIIAAGVSIWGLRRVPDGSKLTSPNLPASGTEMARTAIHPEQGGSKIPAPQVAGTPTHHSKMVDLVRSELTHTDSRVLAFLKRYLVESKDDPETSELVAMRDLTGAEDYTESEWQAAVEDVLPALQALERQPVKSVAELIMLGNWSISRAHYKTAQKQFRLAISQSPDLAEAWIGLAIAVAETAPEQVTSRLKTDLKGWMLARRAGNTSEANARWQSLRGQLSSPEGAAGPQAP